MFRGRLAVGGFCCFAVAFAVLGGVVRGRHAARVGDVTADGTVVPTGRSVAAEGVTAILAAAALDAVVTPDGTDALVKTSKAVDVVALADGTVRSQHVLPGGASLTGIAMSNGGSTVVCSTAGSDLVEFHVKRGILTTLATLKLPSAAIGGPCYPCGLAFLPDGRLVVAANRDNALFVVDLSRARVVKRIPVDTAPYRITIQDERHVLVTCWAAPNRAGKPTADSAGTQVEVDERGIAVSASLCRVDLERNRVTARVKLPLQPTECALDKDRLFVACANGDCVRELRAGNLSLIRSIRVGRLSGSAPDSVSLDPMRRRMYVAFAGLDRIGAYDLTKRRWLGFERTAWYPTVVRAADGGVIVATAKGVGSRSGPGPRRSVFDFTATVSYMRKPAWSAKVPAEPIDGPARANAVPTPVPLRTGEPSVFKHVVYVIKENRTYDQVLGDMKRGNGDPSLTLYGEEVTPNQHALARQFVLLDNYYCNGIISADGHAWATEANATTYYEHSFGGWTRSYPFGDDPLATSVSGYIWDNALDHGRTVRNFGEFDYATPEPSRSGVDLLHAFEAGRALKFKQNIGVARLRRVSERSYPGWNLAIPDALRADRFVRRLHQLESAGTMADLTIVYLPQDHTAGGSAGFPSPRAQVADNDLGLGRVIDALSHSQFWPTTVVFVEEDDPQDGFDHVDGHRSACLVVSPYTKRGAVVSSFYNQASVLHTMERILGLPPMNMNDAEAPVMSAVFQPVCNMQPYSALQNRIPLDEATPAGKRVSFNLKQPDSVDDDRFNRRLWALSGKAAPYPARQTNPGRRGR
ncbi:MAG: bifunctional YncE family protein/alkaline phosphatase family protein [Fimbriimonadaceae bacterium]